MNEKIQRSQATAESVTTLRKRNQVTLPGEAVELLGIRDGDKLVLTIQDGALTLRPVRRSYAGALKGAYARGYLKAERESWE